MNDIVKAERRLGVAFPDSLREWYLNFGGLSNVWNVQDYLVSPADLEIEENRLIIVHEAQGVVRWSIETASLAAPDPGVIVSDHTDPNVHQPAASSVSEFALQMLVFNAKFSERELFRANGQATNHAVVAIEQHLPRLPFGDLYWPLFPTRLYGDEAIFTEIDGLTWIWITARDAKVFDVAVRLAENAGVRWEALARPE